MNNAEFPYSLSIHAAMMLSIAIDKYVEETVESYDESNEFPSFCMLRLQTATKEAEQLKTWIENIEDYKSCYTLVQMVPYLDKLLEDINTLKGRFNVLMEEELKNVKLKK